MAVFVRHVLLRSAPHLSKPSTIRPYTVALTRPVSPKLADAVSSAPNNISYSVAKQQHENYVETLRSILPVRELPELVDNPDGCFVEDAVVAIGGKAVLMRMGHESRRFEVDSMASALQSMEGINIVDDMRNNKAALCDGGDVLFTGRHIFVGLSERTNREGMEVLRSAFSNWEVIGVPLGGAALHLKSIVTHMDRFTLMGPTGKLGDLILEKMQAPDRGYEMVRLPSMAACNVVSVNGTLLAQDVDCQESRMALQEAADESNMRLEFVDTSEFAKVDGALTCCSVLLDI